MLKKEILHLLSDTRQRRIETDNEARGIEWYSDDTDIEEIKKIEYRNGHYMWYEDASINALKIWEQRLEHLILSHMHDG